MKERRVIEMDKVKATMIMAVSALMGWMGILAVPVFLMVG